MRGREQLQLARTLLMAADELDGVLADVPWGQRWLYRPGLRLAQLCLRTAADRAVR